MLNYLRVRRQSLIRGLLGPEYLLFFSQQYHSTRPSGQTTVERAYRFHQMRARNFSQRQICPRLWRSRCRIGVVVCRFKSKGFRTASLGGLLRLGSTLCVCSSLIPLCRPPSCRRCTGGSCGIWRKDFVERGFGLFSCGFAVWRVKVVKP